MSSRLGILRPGRTAQAANIARGVYGLILASSVIAASSEADGDVAGRTAIYVSVTLIVFWVAHVYSEMLARWIDGVTPTLKAAGAVLRSEWAMVSAGFGPIVILLVAGVIPGGSDQTAMDLALGFALAELAATCGITAHRAGAGRAGVAVAVAIGVGLGAIVVGLKTIVH